MPRPTDWIDTIVNLSSTSGGQDQMSLMTGVAPVNMRGMTLIRTIVRLHLASTTVAGAWGTMHNMLAIGVASQEAFAASVLPDPQVATDKPPRGWILRTSVAVDQNGGAGLPITSTLAADIRSGRKVENGEVFLIQRNDFIAGTAFTVRVFGLIRCLYKL